MMRKEIEVMRVLRVPPLGKLQVEVNNNRLSSLAEVQQPKARQLLLAAIGELVDFAGGYQQLVDAGVAPELTPTAPPPPPPAETAPETTLDPQLEAERARFLAQLEAERDAYKTGEQSGGNVSILRPARRTPAPSPPAPEPPSIAAQIDAILQKYVQADPELAQRSIHLRQNPAGGLHIEIDGRFVERPREITDKRVQRAIKLALKEWEQT